MKTNNRISDFEMDTQLASGSGRIVKREWNDATESNAGTVAILDKSAGVNGRLAGEWVATGIGTWQRR